MLLLDVDGFKQVNDTHGHAAGDQLLRDLAAAIQNCVRDTDVPARIGGDEFAILLVNADGAAAAAAAAKVLAATRLSVAGWRTSTSVGMATFGPSAAISPDHVLAAADRALYAAKAAGGDRLAGQPHATDGAGA